MRMNNLQWLYDTDDEFRSSVCESAATWLGSTSTNFASSWLGETHHESDSACPLGQHTEEAKSAQDVAIDSLSSQAYTLSLEKGILKTELDKLTVELEKRDKGIARLKRQRDGARAERDDLQTKLLQARTLPSAMELEEAQRERDAYRELCGKFRAMANEIMCMEVD